MNSPANPNSFKLRSLVQVALYVRFYLQGWTQEMFNNNRQPLLVNPLPSNLRVTLHAPHNYESLWIMTNQVASLFCGGEANREISNQLSADDVDDLIIAYSRRYPTRLPTNYFQELRGNYPGSFNYLCVNELGSYSSNPESVLHEACQQFIVEKNICHLRWLLQCVNDESTDTVNLLQADSSDELYRMDTGKSKQFIRVILKRGSRARVNLLLADVIGVVLDNSLLRDDTVSPGVKAGVVQTEIIKQRLTALLHKELFS